jgi:Na+/H+ antiporter NhaD/arsenite permease-like protein
MLNHSVIGDYIPFIVLLFSLYTISGGIRLTGDVPAHTSTNTVILFIGAMLASVIGTTGASMVLIRPLLQINSERKHVKHTVIFFIFLVSNVGGSLLPVGDPPLFLGYLKGVPFLWTLQLWPVWLTCVTLLLAIYWVLDSYYHKKEDQASLQFDETNRQPLRLEGKINLLLLAGVVFAVALLVPGRELFGTSFVVPDYLREIVQLALCGLSMVLTSKQLRADNQFNFTAIGEVACLFIGIFITMQVPIELLHIKGPELGLTMPAHFFWASGSLSSFLDNAPTYVVFFETAKTLPVVPGVEMLQLPGGAQISVPLLKAIALGSVFMGANTYIGNGPNFLVKSIAEDRGVKMPSFFGYMAYSGAILIPTFILVTFIFFR